MSTVVLRSEDHEECGIRAVDNLLESPGERDPATVVVDMRDKSGTQPAVGFSFARQTGAARVREKTVQLFANALRPFRIAADARGFANGRGQELAIAGAFKE